MPIVATASPSEPDDSKGPEDSGVIPLADHSHTPASAIPPAQHPIFEESEVAQPEATASPDASGTIQIPAAFFGTEEAAAIGAEVAEVPELVLVGDAVAPGEIVEEGPRTRFDRFVFPGILTATAASLLFSLGVVTYAIAGGSLY